MGRGEHGRKDAILDQATRLFAERGYEGTSMADLAERVGLRKASLFHHFASKEQLRRAVLERLVQRITALVGAEAESKPATTDFAQKVDALTDAIVHVFGEQPYAARLLLREAMEWGTGNGGTLAEALAGSMAMSEKFIIAGQQAGAFVPGDPKQIVASFMGMHLLPFAMGGVMEQFMGQPPWTPEFIAARCRAMREQVRAMLLRR